VKRLYRTKLIDAHRGCWSAIQACQIPTSESLRIVVSGITDALAQLEAFGDPGALSQKVQDLENELQTIRRANGESNLANSPGDDDRLREYGKTLQILKAQYRGLEEYLRNGAKLTRDDNQIQIRRLQRKRAAVSKQLHTLNSMMTSPAPPTHSTEQIAELCTEMEQAVISKQRQLADLQADLEREKSHFHSVKAEGEATQASISQLLARVAQMES
jgi:chromosome segregation ATPase